MNLKEFLVKNKEIFQLVYGIALIILIPLIIVFNTFFIINKYSESIDVMLQRQALVVGRSIYSLIRDDLFDPEKLQEKIRSLLEKNQSFQEISILKPDNENFRVIASSNQENVGKAFDFYFYDTAWKQPDNDGLATDSLQLSKSGIDQDLAGNISADERFWLVAMPMRDKEGEKQVLLSINLSSKIVDDLTSQNRANSIYLLIVTILVVALFLMIAVRLWDYALLYKKIKEVDQMKDEFISMASHELRTPVTSIKGYISMILEGEYGDVGEKTKHSLENVGKSADRLGLLVEDLLEVNRIEQGKITMNNKILEASPIIKSVIEELMVQAKEKNLALLYKPHKQELPMINVDPDRFRQILINLIGNAIKYTEKGSVEILTGEKNNGAVLEFKIKDTGMGMTAEDRSRLFQKFYRVQNEKTKKIGGTGLGLWITNQLVELMKGKIAVDSIENVGTQATLSFPVALTKS